MSYTTPAKIVSLVGQAGVDLRTDDADAAELIDAAAAFGTNQIDYYCSRYSATELAANGWVQDAATWAAVMYLCMRRLNEVPDAIQKWWDEMFLTQLSSIRKGEAIVPRAATARNPVSVTNHATDLRRLNNQIRVDRTRSTGIADNYKRPMDPSAPDQR